MEFGFYTTENDDRRKTGEAVTKNKQINDDPKHIYTVLYTVR